MGKDKDQAPEDTGFRQAIGDVKPLEQDGADPYRQRRRPEPLNLPVEHTSEFDCGDITIETPDFLEFRRSGIQHRVFQDLRRGLIEPEGNLDLHGMRVEDARRAFSRFLAHHLTSGRRCVRIVHGRGRRSPGGAPVLKQKTNQWLQQRAEVLAFCSAPRWDGGTGAVYVLLSRKGRRDP
jgi:DNA-nicking Smr family endonuclease